MLPDLNLPASLAGLLVVLRPVFTAPSFRTFCGLAAGLAGQVRRRTVCGMLAGAGLGRCWPHDRAHYFFARAAWDLDELGLAAARVVAALLVPAGAAITVAVDDSVFRRSGRRVFGVAWQHDGSSPARNKLSFGTCFVTAGIVVALPFCTRPVCLPVLARLHVPGKGKARKARKRDAAPASTVSAAVALVTRLAGAFPGRRIDVVADAHYHGPALRDLPQNVTWTTRLPKNAVLYDLAPPRVRKPGRPPRKGPRLGTAADLAAAAAWTPAAVRIYRRDTAEDLAEVTCLWYGCLDVITVRVILARDQIATLALVTTDLAAPAAVLVERYAARWSIEMVFPQLAKGAVRPVGGGREHVADLDLAVGDDHPVDEQFRKLPPLGKRGSCEFGADGLAEGLDAVGHGLEPEPLPGGCVQLPLLGGQGGVAAAQSFPLAL